MRESTHSGNSRDFRFYSSTNRRYTMHNAAGKQQGGPVYARNDASALREFREQHPECFTDEYRERYGPYEMRCHEK